jgi:hypothetical protein
MDQMLRCALCALVIATACGGGETPPGGGNNGSDGGDMTDGPNPNTPLIEAIPGIWRITELEVDGQQFSVSGTNRCDCDRIDCDEILPGPRRIGDPGGSCPAVGDMPCSIMGCVVVDTTNPTCRMRIPLLDGGEAEGDLGPPGDACVWTFYLHLLPFILDGTTIRADPPPGCPSPELPWPWFCSRTQGQVLNSGTRMEYTMESWTRTDRPDTTITTLAFRKIR